MNKAKQFNAPPPIFDLYRRFFPHLTPSCGMALIQKLLELHRHNKA